MKILKVTKANEIAQARRKGWTEVDLKGNGDCAFRCIAAAREFFDSGEVLSQTESKNKGALVRVDAVSHMRRHLERYLPNFAAVDKDIPPEAPALDPATLKGNFDCSSLSAPKPGLTVLCCKSKPSYPAKRSTRKACSRAWVSSTGQPPSATTSDHTQHPCTRTSTARRAHCATFLPACGDVSFSAWATEL